MATSLDARVAALPKRYEELQKSGVETDTDPKSLIIKALQDKIAELQKSALHEPCTYEEGAEALDIYGRYHGLAINGMQAAINSVLQGRAKPAQEIDVNETNAILASRYFDLLKVVERYEKHGVTCQTYQHFISTPCAECNVMQQPAQEEITELPRYDMNWETGHMLPSSRGAWVRYVDIRASKGEKT